MEKKQCLSCRNGFLPNRSDQLFCSKNCRIKFNNDKNNAIRHKLDFINKPLLKNFKILENLMRGKKEAIFHIQFLKGKDFDTKLNTNLVEGKEYPLIGVYNYTIDYIKNSNNVKITRND